MKTLTLLSVTIVALFGCVKKDKPKNILMICIDDLRPQLGCYGHPETFSPNIDKIANKGVLFTNAHCNVPVCGASRASLLTGIRPTPTRFVDFAAYAQKDVPGAVSLPQVFKESGYHTISNGKVFHHADDLDSVSWSEPAWLPKTEQDAYFIPGNDTLRHPRFNWGPWRESADMPDGAYFDGQVAEKTISDLKRLKDINKPFFLAAGFFKPHLPLNAPKKYFDLYDANTLKLAENRNLPQNAPKSLNGSAEPRLYYLGDTEFNSDEYHRLTLEAYYACVSFVDSLVGRVMAELEALDLAENTIVVLWGDHGWNLGEHNFWGKHNLMQNATRIPLIISAPGYSTGVKTSSMAEFVDIFPTLCDLADISTEPLKKQLHGISLKPILSNPENSVKDAVFVRFRHGEKVVTPNYALTEYTVGNGFEFMLFDHKNDPNENKNISEHEAYSTIKEDLLQKINDLKTELSQ